MKLKRHLGVVVIPALMLLGACGSASSGTPAPQVATTTSDASTSAATPTTTHISASPSARPSAGTTASSIPVPKVMPDFVGQTQSAAQATLSQYNVQIKTVNKIDAQPAGTVIEQDPVAGASFAQVVTLTVSTAPATVPNVTGKTFAEAQQQLTKLGFAVKENPIFDQKLADGLVQAQNPPADTANVAEVTLDVIRRPVVTYLADMEAIDSDGFRSANVGTAKSNGKSYSHALVLEPSEYATLGVREYDFSRQYRQLKGDLGLGDKSDSAAVGKVEIYGDGRQLLAQDVPFGTTIPIDVDVTDVLRIKITVTTVDGRSSIVFGDFAAQGLQSEVGGSESATPTSTSR